MLRRLLGSMLLLPRVAMILNKALQTLGSLVNSVTARASANVGWHRSLLLAVATRGHLVVVLLQLALALGGAPAQQAMRLGMLWPGVLNVGPRHGPARRGSKGRLTMLTMLTLLRLSVTLRHALSLSDSRLEAILCELRRHLLAVGEAGRLGCLLPLHQVLGMVEAGRLGCLQRELRGRLLMEPRLVMLLARDLGHLPRHMWLAHNLGHLRIDLGLEMRLLLRLRLRDTGAPDSQVLRPRASFKQLLHATMLGSPGLGPRVVDRKCLHTAVELGEDVRVAPVGIAEAREDDLLEELLLFGERCGGQQLLDVDVVFALDVACQRAVAYHLLALGTVDLVHVPSEHHAELVKHHGDVAVGRRVLLNEAALNAQEVLQLVAHCILSLVVDAALHDAMEHGHSGPGIGFPEALAVAADLLRGTGRPTSVSGGVSWRSGSDRRDCDMLGLRGEDQLKLCGVLCLDRGSALRVDVVVGLRKRVGVAESRRVFHVGVKCEGVLGDGTKEAVDGLVAHAELRLDVVGNGAWSRVGNVVLVVSRLSLGSAGSGTLALCVLVLRSRHVEVSTASSLNKSADKCSRQENCVFLAVELWKKQFFESRLVARLVWLVTRAVVKGCSERCGNLVLRSKGVLVKY